eukprot:CAMPEP_0194046782 /NCGR_PEP_ID=MMETSP0009_2-20130614/22303_1 /TAXON_ID=210454 /ORGANISM="Grammatophora oceanica, Strain CCMP 410" /LENGTH=216 /DNA_ID=CAMNT_0038692201 /DNA_START=43 /DNA_END=693 /DNA_ORIENTATION=-
MSFHTSASTNLAMMMMLRWSATFILLVAMTSRMCLAAPPGGVRGAGKQRSIRKILEVQQPHNIHPTKTRALEKGTLVLVLCKNGTCEPTGEIGTYDTDPSGGSAKEEEDLGTLTFARCNEDSSQCTPPDEAVISDVFSGEKEDARGEQDGTLFLVVCNKNEDGVIHECTPAGEVGTLKGMNGSNGVDREQGTLVLVRCMNGTCTPTGEIGTYDTDP